MDMKALPEDFAQLLTERARRLGSDLNLAELFYSGERHSAGEYLASLGWHDRRPEDGDAYAANGFEIPEDDLTGLR